MRLSEGGFFFSLSTGSRTKISAGGKQLVGVYVSARDREASSPLPVSMRPVNAALDKPANGLR